MPMVLLGEERQVRRGVAVQGGTRLSPAMGAKSGYGGEVNSSKVEPLQSPQPVNPPIRAGCIRIVRQRRTGIEAVIMSDPKPTGHIRR